MSSPQTTVLITGASRGIGRGLTEAYLARPNHTVVAAVRDTSAKSVASLQAIQPANGSKLQVVKINSKVDSDPAEAIKAIQAAGVSSLDIIIANAGIQGPFAKLESADANDIREQVGVNTIAPLLLFQAAMPLLQAASAPKFLAISTMASSIQNLEANTPFMLGGYGASKAALNYIVRRISFEYTWLNAFVMNPGLVQTDMGNAGARFFGMEKAIQTTEESVNGIIKKLDTATTETTSGNFYDWDGSDMKF